MSWCLGHAKNLLRPVKRKLDSYRRRSPDNPKVGAQTALGAPYRVNRPASVSPEAVRVTHVIANFMTGGSSRLVVDLIERLGPDYRHNVLTSHIPVPPAYIGLEIEECRFPVDETPFVNHFKCSQADVVHVHYWGDCDESWYAKAFLAAERLALPVIENVNTPVAPYPSKSVVRYVYVSDYVRRVFGREGEKHVIIHPGSDFSLFGRDNDETLPDNCVGMVYRLETDKLNEKAIEPFIRIVQTRRQTRILIVGGGSLLAPFRKAVAEAGVEDRFEFTGYVGYDALPEFYRRMSLFVAPVWKESFGQVSPFAMNMRIPVIGYDVGALAEITDDPKLLAPPGDAEKLADIAIALLDSPESRDRIGHRQRERAQRYFSLQAMISAYADLYAETGRSARPQNP
ncbi:MAG: glycosyltransferase family 4 protein [Gammaproteobacteria bacterium]